MALTVPVDAARTDPATADDVFATALVAGTIDAGGTVSQRSVARSQLEEELVTTLDGSLGRAVHPDDAGALEDMLASCRSRGRASGSLRFRAGGRRWVTCECQVFGLERDSGGGGVPGDEFAFVVSASTSVRWMSDKVARLERHIKRIGSEVHAAEVDTSSRPPVDPRVTETLDALDLSARQRDIVERLVRGQRVASIAEALFVSRSTVRNHLAQVYQQVGVHSQEELLKALRVV